MQRAESFPRHRRLLTATDFNRVFKQRSFTFRHPTLRLIGRQSDLTEARLGLVVAKRVLPRAVDRNRVKRVLRERFRRLAKELPAVDLVAQPLSAEVLDCLPEAIDELLERVVHRSI